MGISAVRAPINIRAAGSVVANAATATNPLSIPATLSQKLSVFINFTLGSLTNGVFTPQVSYDGTNWYDSTSPGALTMTATGRKSFVVDCTGAKLFRMNVSSSGTTTSSDLSIDVGYQSS